MAENINVEDLAKNLQKEFSKLSVKDFTKSIDELKSKVLSITESLQKNNKQQLSISKSLIESDRTKLELSYKISNLQSLINQKQTDIIGSGADIREQLKSELSELQNQITLEKNRETILDSNIFKRQKLQEDLKRSEQSSNKEMENTLKLLNIAQFRPLSQFLSDSIFGKIERFFDRIPGGTFILQKLGLSDIKKDFDKNITTQLNNLPKGAATASQAFLILGSAVGSAISSIGKALVLNPWVLLIGMIVLAAKRFIEMDKAAETFRRTTGLLESQSKELNNIIRDTSRQYAKFGVTVESVSKNAASIATLFNENMEAVKEFSGYVSVLESNLGIAVEDSAKLLQTFMGLGKFSASSAKSLQLDVVALSKMAGVAPAKVMKDIANASDATLIAVRGSVVQLARAAVNARRLGTNIETISGSMASILEFDTSVNKEMEMSVLLGKHISLNSLRQAAYSGDALSYQTELQNVLERVGDLQGRSPFQIKAISEAMGVSVQELSKMSAQQQLLNKASPELVRQYEDFNDKIKEGTDYASMTEEQADKRLKDLIQQQEMQSKMNKMTAQFQEIWVQIADVLVPIVDLLAKVLVPTVKFIGFALKLVFGVISVGASFIDDILKTIFGSSFDLFEWLNNILDDSSARLDVAINIMKQFPRMLIEEVSNLMTVFKTFGPAIVASVKANIVTLYNTLKEPFSKAWEWIKSIFVGNSPSELGLGIVRGISSVATMVLDALLSPFEGFLNILHTIISDVGKVIGSVFTGMKDIFSDIIEIGKIGSGFMKAGVGMGLLATAMLELTAGKVVQFFTGNPFKSLMELVEFAPQLQTVGVSTQILAESLRMISEFGDAASESISNMSKSVTELSKALNGLSIDKLTAIGKMNEGLSIPTTPTGVPARGDKIEEKLDELIDLMKSGGISVNLDGQLVSKYIAKSLA